MPWFLVMAHDAGPPDRLLEPAQPAQGIWSALSGDVPMFAFQSFSDAPPPTPAALPPGLPTSGYLGPGLSLSGPSHQDGQLSAAVGKRLTANAPSVPVQTPCFSSCRAAIHLAKPSRVPAVATCLSLKELSLN